MARVLYAQSAQTDLLEAWAFIAEENPLAADRVLDTIAHEANTLSSQPLMGRARPELAEDVRSWPTSTAYILFYLADEQGITVLRVLHHALLFYLVLLFLVLQHCGRQVCNTSFRALK